MSLSGTVTDADTGLPLEGVLVDLGGPGDLVFETGVDGVYSFPSIDEGEQRFLRAEKEDYITYSYEGVFDPEAEGPVFDIELEPIPRVSVTGTVTDAVTSNPIEGATITLESSEGHPDKVTQSGVNGTWQVDDVFTRLVDYDVQVTAVGYFDYSFQAANEDPYSPDFNGTVVDVALAPRITISGTVRDGEGTGVQVGVHVAPTREELPALNTSSEVDGTYSIEVDPADGPFYVSAINGFPRYYGFHGSTGTDPLGATAVTVPGTPVSGVDITLEILEEQTATFSGTVRNAQGEPIEGHCVRARQISVQGPGSPVQTNASGEYTIETFFMAPPFDRYFVSADSCFGNDAESACSSGTAWVPLDIIPGETRTVDFVIDGASVSDSCDLVRSAPAEVDANGDGWGDLYVGAESSQYAFRSQLAPNQPPVGSSYGNFQDVEDRTGAAIAFDYFGPGAGTNAVYGLPGAEVGGDPGAGEAIYSAGGFRRVISQSGNVPGTPEPGDGFGSTLASGDFSGDGSADLVVGVPGEDLGSLVDAGAISVHQSLQTNAGKAFSQQGAVRGVEEAGDRFGAALAVGDFNGDGYDDLAVGAPGEDIGAVANAGGVTILPGSAGGLSAAGSQTFSQAGAVNGVVEAGDGFGSSLAVGDFDGDGYDDLAVGVPGEDIGSVVDAGAVNILYGSPSGLTKSGDLAFSQAGPVPGVAEAGDGFGTALAAGDLDNDGYDDLAVGVPDEDIGALTDAGAVAVFEGSAGGLRLTGVRSLTQNRNLRGVSEAGDRLGAAVAIGSLDSDLYADLAVGAPGEDLSGVTDGGMVIIVPGSSSGVDTGADRSLYHHRLMDGRNVQPGEGYGAFLLTR